MVLNKNAKLQKYVYITIPNLREYIQLQYRLEGQAFTEFNIDFQIADEISPPLYFLLPSLGSRTVLLHDWKKHVFHASVSVQLKTHPIEFAVIAK